MQVVWAIPCRFAEATPDGTATIVGAGLDSVWLPEVPADVGVFVMLRVAGAAYEFEEPHTFAMRLVDPQSDEHNLLSLEFGPMAEPPPLLHPGMDPGILVPVAIGWRAEHFGLYTLEIYIDDRRERSVAILVRDQRELEQTTEGA